MLSPVLGSDDIILYGSPILKRVLYSLEFPIRLLFMKKLTADLSYRVIFVLGSYVFKDLSIGKMIGEGH